MRATKLLSVGLLLTVTVLAGGCAKDDGASVRNGGSGSSSVSGSSSAAAGCTPVGEKLASKADTTVDVTLDDYSFDLSETTFAGGVGAVQVVTGIDGSATVDVAAGPTTQAYTITAQATIETAPGITTNRTARFVFAVADAYEVDAVAVDGAGSGYALLNERARPGDAIGPSVNGLGDVAFGGLVVADDRYRVFIAPQGSTPTDPLTTEQGIGTATDEFVVDDVEINDARQVVYTVSRLVGGDVETTIRRSTGTTTVDFDTASTADAFAGPFISVGRPTMNAYGRVVHVGNDSDSFVS